MKIRSLFCTSMFFFALGAEIVIAEEPVAISDSLGIGPVKKVELGVLDSALAEKGKTIFSGKCSACHKLDQRYVGPSLGGVTKRRKPEWIMNMIINPQEMTQKDPVAQDLLGEYLAQMATLNLSEPDARALLEYLRQIDAK